MAEFIVVLLDEPRDEDDGEELELLRRLEIDGVEIQPPLTTVAGHPHDANGE